MRDWVSVLEICPCWAPLLADPDLIFLADATYLRLPVPELWSSTPALRGMFWINVKRVRGSSVGGLSGDNPVVY